MGMFLFYDLPQSDDINVNINLFLCFYSIYSFLFQKESTITRLANWEDFWHAAFLNFRFLSFNLFTFFFLFNNSFFFSLTTGEGWDLIQAQIMEDEVWLFFFFLFMLEKFNFFYYLANSWTCLYS